MIKVYPARGMTGRVKKDVVKEARADKLFLEHSGFTVLCPVLREKVAATKAILLSTKDEMDVYWPQDKRMIREAHVIFDMSPHLNSEGVKHEIGYARYCLWKPVIRVFPSGCLPSDSSIARYEDDYICDSLVEAIEYALRVHGTFFKRLVWRLGVLRRSLPAWCLYQIQEFK